MSEDTEWVDLDEAANIVHLASLNGSGPEPEHDSWTPTNLNDLPDQPPTKPDLAATGLIYPGKRHVFSGPPESAKTLAAYCILIQAARQQQNTILIDFEMGAYDARGRLRELGATPDELGYIHYLEPAEPASEERIRNLLILEAVLVVIDAAAGAYALEGLDDNKRQDVEKIAALYVSAFWRNGIATLFIDHVVKDKEQRGKFSIGSERKLGGADVHLGFEPVKAISRGGTGLYKVLTHKDRGGYLKRGHLCDLHLESDVDTHQIEWNISDPETAVDAEGYFRPTHLMEKVSIDLELRTEPPNRNAVYEALGGTKDYVLKAISALVREGFATETDGPNRSKLLESVRPYREDNPVDNPDPAVSGSVVRQWFGSGSRTTHSGGGLGGSSLRTTYVETTEPPAAAATTAEEPGWFDWISSLEPDADDIDSGGEE